MFAAAPAALAGSPRPVHGGRTYRATVHSSSTLQVRYAFSVRRRALITATLSDTSADDLRCSRGFDAEFERPDTSPVSTGSPPQTSIVTPGHSVRLRRRLRPGRYLLVLGAFSCAPVRYSFALTPGNAIRR